MFDSIEAVLVRRVNISRAHRAGLVLGERQRAVCVCVVKGVCVYVGQYTWLSVLWQWTLTALCSNNNKDDKGEERKKTAYFCLGGFHVWQEWHFFYCPSFTCLLLLDISAPVFGSLSPSRSSGRARACWQSDTNGSVLSKGYALVGVFFFPLNSRPNGCQNQQADYDSVALRLHNYHTGAGCWIGGRRRDDWHKGPSAVISPHKTCNVRGPSKALIMERSRIIFEFCLPCKNHQVTAPSVCSGCIYSMITLKRGSFEDLFRLRGKMATLLNF